MNGKLRFHRKQFVDFKSFSELSKVSILIF
jgi:hypothetical protein